MSRTMTHDGVEYLCGTAGSLIVACTVCGEEHFRDFHYFYNPDWYQCFSGHGQLVPIRMDELESKWYQLWESLGFQVNKDKG